MNATTVTQQQEVRIAGQAADRLQATLILEAVNLEELRRVETRLIQLEQQEKWNTRKEVVFFTNKKGRLDTRTVGAFLEKGLPFLEKGLNSILKDQEHASRLHRLLRLEALYEICKRGVHWNDVTNDMLAEKQATIQRFKATYSPVC